MKLKKDILTTFLDKSNVDVNSLRIWYGFNHWSGHVLFNDIESDPTGSAITGGCINPNGYPAVLVGSGANSFSFNTGSGYFDSESVFKTERVDFLNDSAGFTLLANIQDFDNYSNLDVGKTLLSTMRKGDDSSGFCLGLNGANRIYFHFTDINGNVNKSIQSKHEINNYAIFSIAYRPNAGASDSYFDYATHDIVNLEENVGEKWSTSTYHGRTNIKASNTLYMGDLYEQTSGYTGFKGSVGDVLIFKGILSTKTRQEISKAFFAESITPESVTTRSVTEDQIVSGASGITQYQITGTGITGYEQVELKSPIATRDGSNTINQCQVINSGVTGLLSGQVTTYETYTGAKTVTKTYTETTPETINYSISSYAPYAKSNLIFFNPIESDELYEVYSYSDKSDRLNRCTELEFSPINSNHPESPVSICERFSDQMCTNASWSGKVCYPCNKYTGESECGDCHKITGTVDGPCEPEDTCESGFANVGDCKKFVFEECIRRFDAPVGSFDLKKTVIPSVNTYLKESYKFSRNPYYETSGGNVFINGVFTKEGRKDCELMSTQSNSLTNRGVYNACSVKSGNYVILDNYRGYFSGNHSFDIRYRFDVYDPTGHRSFNTSDYIYIPPTKEFVVFDDIYNYDISGETQEVRSGFFEPYISGTGSLSLSETGGKYLNKDVYLNGLKLTSGYNYIENSSTGIDLIRSTLPAIDDAELSFVPRPVYSNRITGENIGNHKDAGFALLSEQVWVNGIRQVEGVNYIKTPKNSLLNSDIILRSHSASIYSNTQDFFNQ